MLFRNIFKIFVRAFCGIICRNVAFRGRILCYPGQLFVHIRSSANKHVCSEQEKALSITNKAYQSSTNTCLETTLSTVNNQKQMHAVQSRAAGTYLKIDTTHVDLEFVKKFTRPNFRAKEFYTLKTRKSRLFSPAINSVNASLSVIWPSFG